MGSGIHTWHGAYSVTHLAVRATTICYVHGFEVGQRTRHLWLVVGVFVDLRSFRMQLSSMVLRRVCLDAQSFRDGEDLEQKGQRPVFRGSGPTHFLVALRTSSHTMARR